MSSLIAELASAAAAEKGLVFEEAIEERLCAYSRAVAHFPTAVKEVNVILNHTFEAFGTISSILIWLVDAKLLETRTSFAVIFASHLKVNFMQFKWRNGWFYSLSDKAVAEGKPDPCPLHTGWLKELKVV